jgi:hypothetical protein
MKYQFRYPDLLQIVLLSATIISCTNPSINAGYNKPIPNSWILPDSSMSNQDRWNQIVRPKLFPYPPLGYIARIHGMLVMDVIFDQHGKVSKITRVDGPVQLFPSAESWAMNMVYAPASTSPTDPWSFRLFMKFDLRGSIGVGPHPNKLQVEKVFINRASRPDD